MKSLLYPGSIATMLLLAGILLLPSTTTLGQGAQFGFRGGINLAQWSSDHSNSITTFHGGAFVRKVWTDTWGMQVELLYSSKGADISDFIPANPMEFTVNYLNLPVLLQYSVGVVRFELGPEVGYLLSNKIVVNGAEQNNTDEFFETWDIGMAGGAHFRITESIGLNVRYVRGLARTAEIFFVDQNGQGLGILEDTKNRTLQLGVLLTL